jgi:hypothetical protein
MKKNCNREVGAGPAFYRKKKKKRTQDGLVRFLQKNPLL